MERRLILAGLTGAIVASAAHRVPAQAVTGYDLITTEDMAERTGSVTRALRQLSSDGPTLVVHAPSASTVRSPVDFDVEFRPRGGVAPDLSSIRVDYNLGIAWKNVTRRLLSHARVDGNRLRSAGAKLPAGTHELKLSIRDLDRRRTEAILELTVL